MSEETNLNMKPEQNQLKILKKFSQQADKLMDSKFNELHNFKLNFEAKENEPIKIHYVFPDRDLLKIFLMDARFFLIKDKNEHEFTKICNFFINQDYKKDKVEGWLSVYQEYLDIDYIKIIADGKKLTNKSIFNIILNDEHFHQERGQKGLSQFIDKELLEPLVRMKFYDSISKFHQIICSFNQQIVKPYIKNYEN